MVKLVIEIEINNDSLLRIQDELEPYVELSINLEMIPPPLDEVACDESILYQFRQRIERVLNQEFMALLRQYVDEVEEVPEQPDHPLHVQPALKQVH